MLFIITISTFVCISLVMMGIYWLFARPQSAATERLKRLGQRTAPAVSVSLSSDGERPVADLAGRVLTPLDRLVPPNPETPLPPGPVLRTVTEAVDRVYWYAVGRAPTAAERRVAEAALRISGSTSPSADGLADLMWSIMMTPEFQLIR